MGTIVVTFIGMIDKVNEQVIPFSAHLVYSALSPITEKPDCMKIECNSQCWDFVKSELVNHRDYVNISKTTNFSLEQRKEMYLVWDNNADRDFFNE